MKNKVRFNFVLNNWLGLLKAVGRFAPLPIAASRTMKLGGTVATVGFPDKLKEPNTKEESFEEVVKSAQEAAVLVLVY